MRIQSDKASLTVEVTGGLPAHVNWNDQPFEVLSAEAVGWVQGRWWLHWEKGGTTRRTFRVELRNRYGYSFHAELVHENAAREHPKWKLSKILD